MDCKRSNDAARVRIARALHTRCAPAATASARAARRDRAPRPRGDPPGAGIGSDENHLAPAGNPRAVLTISSAKPRPGTLWQVLSPSTVRLIVPRRAGASGARELAHETALSQKVLLRMKVYSERIPKAVCTPKLAPNLQSPSSSPKVPEFPGYMSFGELEFMRPSAKKGGGVFLESNKDAKLSKGGSY